MSVRRIRLSLSIGAKTLISHVTMCLVVIVLASALSYVLSSQYMRETRMEDLLQKADRIAESARPASGMPVMPNWHTLRIYEDLTRAKLFFIEADTETIRVSSYPNGPLEEGADEIQWTEMLDTIDRKFAERVLAGEKVSAMQRFEFAQDEILFAGVPMRDESGEIRGGLILAQPVDQLRSLSRMVRFLLAGVICLSLPLAVVLAMELTQMLVRPIQRITRAARRMEEGIYAERITQLPEDEIGELGHALNSMSGRLMDVIRNLRKERDKLELVMSGIGEGIIAVNTRWHIVHVNHAFLELTEVDNSARILEEGGDDGFHAQLRALMRHCMQTGVAEELEMTTPSNRALRAFATPLKDDGGNVLGTVCLLRDVSEAQRMEQLRRDYVANISHELRTPLTGIRGMVEPLIDGCMDTEEERLDSYRIILKETIRLEKLVGEMLDMSRLQDGRIKVEMEPLELPGILDAAVRSMAPIAEEAGVDLRVETDGSPLACMGNEDRIMQVLVILIDNALSFTPRGGSVLVFARDGRRFVSVGVRDTGCGIEPKDLPMIWERFYKADKSRMRTTGTGLGLSIAKLVTQLMGGEISVRSEPGKGSEFIFTLPKE